MKLSRVIGLAVAVVVGSLNGCGSPSNFGSGDAAADGGGLGFGDGATSGACADADANHASVGCDYYAIHMDGGWSADNGCFVSFLANTSSSIARVKVSFQGIDIALADHARIPHGAGKKLSLDPFDPGVGIPPGEVAILFLAGPPTIGTPKTGGDFNTPVECPVIPAFSTLTQLHGTGKGRAFHISTTSPVVAYQMLPYGGGSAAVTGATLLLPTSVYGTNYIAVDAYGASATSGAAASSMDSRGVGRQHEHHDSSEQPHHGRRWRRARARERAEYIHIERGRDTPVHAIQRAHR